jgi:broad specificity phosphatase PhoE
MFPRSARLVRHGESTGNVAGLAQGLPVRTDNRPRERSLGVLKWSRSITIYESVTGLAGGLVVDPGTRPPAGESVRDLYLRAPRSSATTSPGNAAIVRIPEFGSQPRGGNR